MYRIFEISVRDIITAEFTIVVSRTLKIAGNHVKFVRFVLLPVSEEAKNMTSASADNPYLDLDYSGSLLSWP